MAYKPPLQPLTARKERSVNRLIPESLTALAALRASSGLMLTARATGPECVPAAQFKLLIRQGHPHSLERRCSEIFEAIFYEEEPAIPGEENTDRLKVGIVVEFICHQHAPEDGHNWETCQVEVKRRVPPFNNRFVIHKFEAKMGEPLVKTEEERFEEKK